VGDATKVVWSREGVRMGCPLGSFGFDLALQAVLEQASQRNGLHVVRAITDDAAIAVRLPDDHQAAAEALRALRSNFDDMRTDARDQLGLSLNLPKCALLLPRGHTLQQADLTLFADITVCARGMKVAGAPIGDDAFCADFVGAKVDNALTKLQTLLGIHPQVGLHLLRVCCMPQLNYLAQVVPPSLTADHFSRFDAGVADLVLQLMTLSGECISPVCADARLAAFKMRLRLPLRFNGAGLIGVDAIGAAAFTASVVTSAHEDSVLMAHIAGLTRFATPALARLRACLDQLGAESVNAHLRLPHLQPVDLFNPSRYVEIDDNDVKTFPKLQREWSRAVSVAAVKRLAPVEMALGDADFIHAEARARPVVAILTAKLSNEFFRLSPRDFVAWFRFQFRLPQIPHLGNADLTGVERCLGICSRRREVDLYGNHANSSCLATGAGRGARHSYLKQCIAFMAGAAGCLVSGHREEATAALLLNEFSAEECSTMFPESPTKDFASKARLIAEGYRKARADAQRPGDVVVNELDHQLRALRATAGKKRGLRLDGTIRHLSSGDEVWFDVTATHSTCHSKLRKELRLTKLRKTAGKTGNRMKSAAVLDAHTKKRDKYALLEAIVERQLISGLRSHAPRILPVAISTHGEFCAGAVELQDWLAYKFERRLENEGSRDDGQKETKLIAEFRNTLRTSLLVGLAKGHAQMLRAAGLPHRAKACRPRAVHYSSQADDVGSSSDGEQTLSDDDADGLTVSSSVSGTPQSAAAIASPPRVGVPGCPGPSQLISSLEAFHSDDASLADSLFF
jgi:hypothetical protein